MIDITFDYDGSEAATTDDVADAVDYSVVARRAVDVIEREQHNLLERLASRIVDVVLGDDRIASVRVSVAKPHAPLGLDADSVSVAVAVTS